MKCCIEETGRSDLAGEGASRRVLLDVSSGRKSIIL
jgi:hypothetical protein